MAYAASAPASAVSTPASAPASTASAPALAPTPTFISSSDDKNYYIHTTQAPASTFAPAHVPASASDYKDICIHLSLLQLWYLISLSMTYSY
jgi:hypothetical protein